MSAAVRSITTEILGMASTDSLIQQTIPAIGVIDIASFRAGVSSNELQFTFAAKTVGRVGIFAAGKGQAERAVILLLPQSATPDRVLICITQGFGRNAAKTLQPLGWSNPLSPALIKFCLLKHVVNRWGAQTLASKKNMAMMYIVRAEGDELGPFAHDGAFVHECLEAMVSLTANAFSYDHVEAFTFSSGILNFNPFLSSIGSELNVEAVYNIDPAPPAGAGGPKGIVRRQFLSGATGGPLPGFEFLHFGRWKNEDEFDPTLKNKALFDYLHNRVMPLYALYLGIQTS